jgi:hypothetical protein
MIRDIKICILKNELKSIYRDIKNYEKALCERDQRFHNGKLNVDRILEEYIKSKSFEIWKLKRDICKLKNNLS